MDSQLETAWLAGLLEGEGCFTVSKYRNKRPKLRVELRMTDKDIVEKASSIGKNSSPVFIEKRKHKNNNWNDAYGIHWSGKKGEDLILRILPYMGERRTARINELLSLDLSHKPEIDLLD